MGPPAARPPGEPVAVLVGVPVGVPVGMSTKPHGTDASGVMSAR